MLCLGNLCYQTKSYGLLHGILTLGTFHSSSMNTKDIQISCVKLGYSTGISRYHFS